MCCSNWFQLVPTGSTGSSPAERRRLFKFGFFRRRFHFLFHRVQLLLPTFVFARHFFQPLYFLTVNVLTDLLVNFIEIFVFVFRSIPDNVLFAHHPIVADQGRTFPLGLQGFDVGGAAPTGLPGTQRVAVLRGASKFVRGVDGRPEHFGFVVVGPWPQHPSVRVRGRPLKSIGGAVPGFGGGFEGWGGGGRGGARGGGGGGGPRGKDTALRLRQFHHSFVFFCDLCTAFDQFLGDGQVFVVVIFRGTGQIGRQELFGLVRPGPRCLMELFDGGQGGSRGSLDLRAEFFGSGSLQQGVMGLGAGHGEGGGQVVLARGRVERRGMGHFAGAGGEAERLWQDGHVVVVLEWCVCVLCPPRGRSGNDQEWWLGRCRGGEEFTQR